MAKPQVASPLKYTQRGETVGSHIWKYKTKLEKMVHSLKIDNMLLGKDINESMFEMI